MGKIDAKKSKEHADADMTVNIKLDNEKAKLMSNQKDKKVGSSRPANSGVNW